MRTHTSPCYAITLKASAGSISTNTGTLLLSSSLYSLLYSWSQKKIGEKRRTSKMMRSQTHTKILGRAVLGPVRIFQRRTSLVASSYARASRWGRCLELGFWLLVYLYHAWRGVEMESCWLWGLYQVPYYGLDGIRGRGRIHFVGTRTRIFSLTAFHWPRILSRLLMATNAIDCSWKGTFTPTYVTNKSIRGGSFSVTKVWNVRRHRFPYWRPLFQIYYCHRYIDHGREIIPLKVLILETSLRACSSSPQCTPLPSPESRQVYHNHYHCEWNTIE